MTGFIIISSTIHEGMTVSVPAMLGVGEGDGMVQVCVTLHAVDFHCNLLVLQVYKSNLPVCT